VKREVVMDITGGINHSPNVPNDPSGKESKKKKSQKGHALGYGNVKSDTNSPNTNEMTISKIVNQPLLSRSTQNPSGLVSVDDDLIANAALMNDLENVERREIEVITKSNSKESEDMEKEVDREIDEIYEATLHFARDEMKKEFAEDEYKAIVEEKRLEDLNRKIDKEIEKRNEEIHP
jgi:hypothetical protein